MREILLICRKELNSYFAGPVAWVLLGMFSILMGFFFWNTMAMFVVFSNNPNMSRGMPMNVNEMVIRPFLQNMSVIGLFLMPLITMRLFAEEKRQGTMELLMTSPVSDWQILLGKWLAAWLMYLAMASLAWANFIFLFIYGQPDWKPMLMGMLGLALQAGALLSLGVFISNLTKNQIIAAVGTFGVCLMLWVIEWVSSYESAAWAQVLNRFSVVAHTEPFMRGIFDTRHLLFFVSMTFFGLFLTARSLESARWKG
jgi:ABC-2 type transport system permease protein